MRLFLLFGLGRAEDIGILDDAESQRQVVLVNTDSHTGRHGRMFEIDVLEQNFNAFVFEKGFEGEGSVVSVYGNGDKSHSGV